MIRKLSTLCYSKMLSLSIAFIAFLKVYTNISAKPLVAGWYGVEVICLTPFSFMNFLNSSETNCHPLSVHICSGNPFLENIILNTKTVFSDVVVFIGTTLGYLECAIKNTESLNGPAKSTCTLCHGVDSHSHGCKGANGGEFWVL